MNQSIHPSIHQFNTEHAFESLSDGSKSALLANAKLKEELALQTLGRSNLDLRREKQSSELGHIAEEMDDLTSTAAGHQSRVSHSLSQPVRLTQLFSQSRTHSDLLSYSASYFITTHSVTQSLGYLLRVLYDDKRYLRVEYLTSLPFVCLSVCL